MSKRPSLKDFIKSKREEGPQGVDVEILAHKPSKNAARTTIREQEKERQYVTIAAGPEEFEFVIGSDIARLSQTISNMLWPQEGEYKETRERRVHLVEYDPVTIETVLRFCEEQHFADRAHHSLSFAFEIPVDMLLHVLYCANFLDIKPLIEFAARAVAQNIDDVYPLSLLPDDVLRRVCEQLRPQQVLKVAKRDDFLESNIDIDFVWPAICAHPSLSLSFDSNYARDMMPPQCAHWTTAIDRPTDADWKALYVESVLQKKCDLMTQPDDSTLADMLPTHAPFVRQFVVRDSLVAALSTLEDGDEIQECEEDNSGNGGEGSSGKKTGSRFKMAKRLREGEDPHGGQARGEATTEGGWRRSYTMNEVLVELREDEGVVTRVPRFSLGGYLSHYATPESLEDFKAECEGIPRPSSSAHAGSSPTTPSPIFANVFLNHFTSLRSLCFVSAQHITPSQFACLNQYLESQSSSTLSQIVLRSCNIGALECASLCRAIIARAHANPSSTPISLLDLAENCIPQEGFSFLVASLSLANLIPASLTLERNPLGTSIPLSESQLKLLSPTSIPNLPSVPSTSVLAAAECRLMDPFSLLLFAQSEQCTLKELDVSACGLSQRLVLDQVAEALAEITSLTTLRMSFNPWGKKAHVKSSDPVVAAFFPAEALAPTLIPSHLFSHGIPPNLVTWSLEKCNLEDRDLVRLSQSLAGHRYLQNLTLAYNGIDEGSADGLHIILSTCSNLQKLDLSYNRLSPSCVQALATGVHDCPTLRELDVRMNSILSSQVLNLVRECAVARQYGGQPMNLQLLGNDIQQRTRTNLASIIEGSVVELDV